jgi:allene oxide cyclase
MRRITVIAALGAAVVLAIAAVAAAHTPDLSEATRMHVVEHATTDTVVDTNGDGQDSTGDLLTFHNKVFNASNSRVVGRDQGQCVRIDPARGTWECNYTVILDGGNVTVEGPFYDARDTSIFSVIGGTGRFRNVRGQLVLHPRDSGAAFDFLLRLIP